MLTTVPPCTMRGNSTPVTGASGLCSEILVSTCVNVFLSYVYLVSDPWCLYKQLVSLIIWHSLAQVTLQLCVLAQSLQSATVISYAPLKRSSSFNPCDVIVCGCERFLCCAPHGLMLRRLPAKLVSKKATMTDMFHSVYSDDCSPFFYVPWMCCRVAVH